MNGSKGAWEGAPINDALGHDDDCVCEFCTRC